MHTDHDAVHEHVSVPEMLWLMLAAALTAAANNTTPKWSFRVGHKARPNIIHLLHILLERLVCFESSCFRH